MIKKTGLIILSITAVLITSATFTTVGYNSGVSKVQKQIVENNILLAKKAADKIQAAKSNSGMTVSKAKAMAYKLHPDYNWKLSDGTELPKNDAYHEFKMFDLNWVDVGADWYFVVNKKTGLAYKHYSDNSLERD